MATKFTDPIAALAHMLDAFDRRPDRKEVRIWPDYAAMTSSDQLVAFRDTMEAARDTGAVALHWEKDDDEPQGLRSVTLLDAASLAAFLCRPRAASAADAAAVGLDDTLADAPEWVRALMGEVVAGWRCKRPVLPGLAVNDVAAATTLVALLAAIDRDAHTGLDMRTFSRRACGDSKALERMKATVVAALRRRLPLPDASPHDALAAIGIEKFPQPILVRGVLRLNDGTLLHATPFIGLPAEWAETAELVAPPPYVLTIENLASFNRHVREVVDDGLIVLSNGFPARATLAFLKRLDALLPADVPFLHWGDVDAGGLRILRHIEAALARPLHPHRMPLGATGFAATVEDVEAYLSVADVTPFEQEELDPAEPKLIFDSNTITRR